MGKMLLVFLCVFAVVVRVCGKVEPQNENQNLDSKENFEPFLVQVTSVFFGFFQYFFGDGKPGENWIKNSGNPNPNSVCGGIFEGDAGEIEFHRENFNVDDDDDDANASTVCIWTVKLLLTDPDGARVSLKLEDLDENSVVNLNAEGEPSIPANRNTPITLNSTQINSVVDLSGKIFIITLKSQIQLDEFETPPTKFVLSWSCVEKTPNTDPDSKLNSSKVVPVETTKTTTELPTPRKPHMWAWQCPDASTIFPCTCYKDSRGIELYCWNVAVDQTGIENVFRELRRRNGIPEDHGFSIWKFALAVTNLTTFDLAPLYGSRMRELSILYNENLTKFVTSGNPRDHGSIQVDEFHLGNSPRKRDDFRDTLQYFSNQMTAFYLSAIDLSNPNNNNTEQDDNELVPGLSALEKLTYLSFHVCNISRGLRSSHLQKFPRLETIDLRWNEIDGIGEAVFPARVSTVFLRGNKLNETSFHPDSGIALTGRETAIDLENNQIPTLHSQIFHTFLSAHPRNKFVIRGNPLICDQGLSWLKSGREEFEDRVGGAYCENDPGYTVFDSDLIP